MVRCRRCTRDAAAAACLCLRATLSFIVCCRGYAVSVVERPEIVVEGTLDGKSWQEVEFLYVAITQACVRDSISDR
jgi:hypothetical protein